MYLAGAKFEEEDVGGYAHYKPTEIPNEALSEFAVSGGANSVTTTIQATTITLKGKNGKEERITICDTPGFGDTKGTEMEISNGLGIVHALKGAASIKPVIVIDHRGMDCARWLTLRKNLSTVIAMMGRESVDFSPFSYIFTHCEGKSKRRISKQLSSFQDAVRQDPHMKDKDILDALLTDMISKTKPDDVICIDPEESDDAQETLGRLWSGPRLDNPADSFVNFASNESMAALLLQVKMLVNDLESSLKIGDLDSTKTLLNKMMGIAGALSLSAVDNAIQQGITKATEFLNQLSSDIETLMTRVDSEFEETLNALSPKSQLVSKSGGICDICGIQDFDYNTVIDDITVRLFSMVRKSIFDVDPSILGSADFLQRSIIRIGLLDTLLCGLVRSDKINIEYATVIETIENLLNPILKALEDFLHQSDPKSTTLSKYLPQLGFVLAMKDFFSSSQFPTTNLKSLELALFKSSLNNILENINGKSQSCATCLEDLDKNLHEELLGEREWSCSSLLKLSNSAEYKEYRDFLQTVSSSESLVAAICEDSTQDFKTLIRDFDDYISKYSQGAVYFLQCQSQAVFDNETGEMAGRIKEAKDIAGVVDSIIDATNTLHKLNTDIFKKVLEESIDVKSRLKQFIEDAKRTSTRHTILRGKFVEPSGEELVRTKNKHYKQNLLRWYEKFNELKAYWKKHGHCNVPKKDPKLGNVSRINLSASLLIQSN